MDTATFAILLYGLFVLLVFYMARAAGTLSVERLLQRDLDLHKQVHAVLHDHPCGGTWRQFKAWMAERD